MLNEKSFFKKGYAHLLLVFPELTGRLSHIDRGTEEALAVGGALVLDFDVRVKFTCL